MQYQVEKLNIRVLKEAEYPTQIMLREEILRKPLGLSFSDKDLKAEQGQIYIGGFLGDELVAGCMLVDLPDYTMRIRQVAVASAHQGKGLGEKLMIWCEKYAKEKNHKKIILNAREDVKAFYLKLGYLENGEPMMELGLVHRWMKKDLI
ncbi:MAG: GNAT family N-acetyltransferase [Candidatus Caenarcaniphilales bacterium]|nr:GNAT family N-acetyltransferase [Candidatus Caenarcaniphilales bacterium]